MAGNTPRTRGSTAGLVLWTADSIRDTAHKFAPRPSTTTVSRQPAALRSLWSGGGWKCGGWRASLPTRDSLPGPGHDWVGQWHRCAVWRQSTSNQAGSALVGFRVVDDLAGRSGRLISIVVNCGDRPVFKTGA